MASLGIPFWSHQSSCGAQPNTTELFISGGQNEDHPTNIHFMQIDLQILKVILHLRAVKVTTVVVLTPGNNWPIGQDRGKCAFCGLKSLNVPEVISNCWAVTAIVWITKETTDRKQQIHPPRLQQMQCKCLIGGLNLLHIPQLILQNKCTLDRPRCNHRAISQDRGKCPGWWPQTTDPSANRGAVTTTQPGSPQDNYLIRPPGLQHMCHLLPGFAAHSSTHFELWNKHHRTLDRPK